MSWKEKSAALGIAFTMLGVPVAVSANEPHPSLEQSSKGENIKPEYQIFVDAIDQLVDKSQEPEFWATFRQRLIDKPQDYFSHDLFKDPGAPLDQAPVHRYLYGQKPIFTSTPNDWSVFLIVEDSTELNPGRLRSSLSLNFNEEGKLTNPQQESILFSYTFQPDFLLHAMNDYFLIPEEITNLTPDYVNDPNLPYFQRVGIEGDSTIVQRATINGVVSIETDIQ